MDCFAGMAGDHRRPSRCDWRSVDGAGCNFERGHVGWHERHIRPECPCLVPAPILPFEPEWLRRQRASLLPIKDYTNS